MLMKFSNQKEIHPEILEHLCHYLSVPPASTNQQLTRRYIWGPLEQSSVQALTTSKITTVEDGRQISGGTTGLRTCW